LHDSDDDNDTIISVVRIVEFPDEYLYDI